MSEHLQLIRQWIIGSDCTAHGYLANTHMFTWRLRLYGSDMYAYCHIFFVHELATCYDCHLFICHPLSRTSHVIRVTVPFTSSSSPMPGCSLLTLNMLDPHSFTSSFSIPFPRPPFRYIIRGPSVTLHSYSDSGLTLDGESIKNFPLLQIDCKIMFQAVFVRTLVYFYCVI